MAIRRELETPKGPQRRRRTPSPAQVQRNIETRQKLIEAAAHVVGEHGYAGCSISRVTARAGVAHGAFYLHFKSQQDLFDVLLPEVSLGMLAAIAQAVRGAETLEDMERRGITANIDYLVKNPFAYRAMYEASHYAPKAFARHNEIIMQGYTRSFRRLLGDKAPDQSQIDELTAILVGARAYLYMRFSENGAEMKPLDPDLLDRYVSFVSAGMSEVLGVDAKARYQAFETARTKTG
ncbi:MAG TPA: TetR/AcrR family transcriptional regulator [Tianweitania sediminis]|nr:TetR/AcrR family transcriptional regulator [Tianweitania sediminis]